MLHKGETRTEEGEERDTTAHFAGVEPTLMCLYTNTVQRFLCLSRVSEITHRHTFTFTQALHTPRRVPHGGGLKGRHAHGELEAHGGCSERYGSRVRENGGR